MVWGLNIISSVLFYVEINFLSLSPNLSGIYVWRMRTIGKKSGIHQAFVQYFEFASNFTLLSSAC